MKRQTVDEFVRDFEHLADTFGQDQTRALEECAELMLDGIHENFRGAHDALGNPWPPRKDPGPKHPLLILEGHLAAAATHGAVNRIVNQNELHVGVSKTEIPYAGVHQEGWPEKNIAQREYLGFSNPVLDACTMVISEYAMMELG